jgi:hypothetical protein
VYLKTKQKKTTIMILQVAITHALVFFTKSYGCFSFVCLFVSSISKKRVLFIICLVFQTKSFIWVSIMLFWYFLNFKGCSKYIMMFQTMFCDFWQ